MRRVVITGLGIICPIGNNASEVEESLRAGRSGITFQPDYAEHGFRVEGERFVEAGIDHVPMVKED